MKQLEKLYFDYKQDLFNYLLSLTHDTDQAEDLLSETFYHAIIAIKTFKGKSAIKTWLFGIARNLWLQSLRKKRSTVEYNDLLELYVADRILEEVITKHILERIFELLKTKDERTQEIINMRVNGFSYFEISEKLGITENSARVIDFRTKRWLKDILEKEDLI